MTKFAAEFCTKYDKYSKIQRGYLVKRAVRVEWQNHRIVIDPAMVPLGMIKMGVVYSPYPHIAEVGCGVRDASIDRAH